MERSHLSKVCAHAKLQHGSSRLSEQPPKPPEGSCPRSSLTPCRPSLVRSKMSQRDPADSNPCAPRVHFNVRKSIQQDSCFNTISGDMTESGLWTLPGFDDEDSELCNTATLAPPKHPNRWSQLLQKAAFSNRERHRTRLEGDGWAFVGGRYSDDVQELSEESAESVDEEFDVVILPRASIGC